MAIIKTFRFLLIFIILLTTNFVKAQDTTITKQTVEVVSLNKIKAYLVGFGLEREQKITELAVVYFGASIESIVPFFPRNPSGSDALRFEYNINIAPVVVIGFKKYYNLKRRENLVKTTLNNSASFVGFEYNLVTPMLINTRYKTKYVNSISPIWGFQKSVSTFANLELTIGPSLQTDFNNTRISGFARFGLNFLL
ncbi:MAG: hypothetical protein EOO91_11200 [Pedobacter sp.]|nr:MAG: hypothetical protein EOO91_11200 [Pedobacter sp.]